MKGQHIRWIILGGIIAITGIIITQVYWVRKAFSSEERRITQSIYIALKDVAENIAKFNKGTIASQNPVSALSADYYIVHINDEIDANILEYYLKKSFADRDIQLDFEYGIYDCGSDKMVYGNYVRFDKQQQEQNPSTELPTWNQYDYYFGVRFPNLSNHLADQMGIWIFSSAILLLVIIIFGYSSFVILKQKRLSEIQKDFINNMTHEFKTPISTIAIASDVINNPEIIKYPERLSNYAQIIKSENMRLQKQVEKVLQMARINRKHFKLNLESVDLHELITNTTQSLSISVKEKAGEIDYQLKAKKFNVRADRVHLTNIVYNLVDNAIKYSKEAPKITIKTENSTNRLMLSVSDQGIGIDKTYQKRIFQKFFRVPTGNVHNVKGFGLGLNYVSTMVKAHGWEIKVQSEVGLGSVFIIEILLQD